MPLLPRSVILTIVTLMTAVAAAAAPVTAAATTAQQPPFSSSDPQWLWPTTNPRVILREFAAPATRFGAGHRGMDIEARMVVAPADGVVHFSGNIFGRGVLSIEHNNGLLSSYEPVISSLVKGEPVHRGQVVAEVAPPTTHCDVGCLHFGVRLDGEYVSPMNFFGLIPRSILLPSRQQPR
ncbi:MAG: family metallopeptidase [Glaciihabitans sp.]|nr:family metallopeptidase [Glaciihabitans sp.]